MTTPQIPWSGRFVILNADGKLMELSGIILPTNKILALVEDGGEINGDDLVLHLLDDAGATEVKRFRGGIQPKIYTRRSAVSANAVISVAAFNSGLSSQTDVVPVGGGAVDRYIAFWQPATELEVTVIREADEKGNARAEFGDPMALTVGGVAGYFWASDAMIAASRLGKNWIFDTEGAERRVIPKLGGWSADDTIDAADLASADTVLSYSNFILIPFFAPSAGYLWAAVPIGDEPSSPPGIYQAFGVMIAQPSVVYDGTTWATYRFAIELDTGYSNTNNDWIQFRY